MRRIYRMVPEFISSGLSPEVERHAFSTSIQAPEK